MPSCPTPEYYDGGRISSMNRRQFVSSSGVALAAIAGSSSEKLSAAPTKPVLMKLGCQSAPSNEKHFQYFARYGVRNICGYPEIADGRLYATVEELTRLRDLAGKYGISVDCVAPPFLTSSHIDSEKHRSEERRVGKECATR